MKERFFGDGGMGEAEREGNGTPSSLASPLPVQGQQPWI
ncbi:hypothetical protein ART_1091 [Arthrobacter sp. PAMC 25486]|nr:hypothetical protein ART_1091 [Arthrobacter sp. PAMC 25486]